MALQSILSQYFLSPLGLLGLLGLIPLIAFYLIRPEPEERVMPSMAFFIEDKKRGKIDQALNRILRNLLLIVHILTIIGLAAALADLYIHGEARPDRTVIVLDRSASMQNDMGDAKSFIRSNLGEHNTLIVAGEEVDVPLERASKSKIRQRLNSIESRDVETDISAALEVAADYRGTVTIASDLDQTVSERPPEELVKNLETDRSVNIMDADNSNSWGIVGVNAGRKNSSVDIKNFLDQEREITVTVNEDTRQRTVAGGEVETVVFSSSRLNHVELEDDEVAADNSAYISVPGDENYDVLSISDSRNPYFKKAIELIEFTDIQTARPPIQRRIDADIYVIGETSRILETEVEKIKRDVEQGASLVVFAQPDIREKGLDFLPSLDGRQNASVEIERPRRINVGGTEVYELESNRGESLSEPDNAVRKLEYGEGEVLFYNIRDEDFHFDFLYPIFWKETFADMVGRPSVNELNIRTGEQIEGDWVETPEGNRIQGPVTATNAGFYNTSKGVYGVTLTSEDESDAETPELDLGQVDEGGSDKNLKRLVVVLLAALAFLELAYLRYTGDI